MLEAVGKSEISSFGVNIRKTAHSVSHLYNAQQIQPQKFVQIFVQIKSNRYAAELQKKI